MGVGGSNTTATVTLNANMDPSGVLNAVKTMQGAFNSLKINPNLTGEITKEFGNLQKLLEDYRKAMDKPVTSKKDLKNLESLEKAINSSFSTITKLYDEINGKTILTKVDSTQLDVFKAKTREAQKALQDAFSNIKIGTSNNGLREIESSIEKAVGRSKTLKNSFSEVFSNLYKSGDIDKFTGSLDSIFNNLSSKLKADKLKPTIDSLLNSFKSLGLIKIDTPLDSTAEKLLALKDGFTALKTAIANGVSGDELKVLIDNLDKATEAENKFHAEASKRGQNNYNEQAESLRKVADEAKRAGEEQRKFKQQTLEATTQLEQLQSSTQYFFGLRNMINLLKRGLREAIDTIKELDAAMTETAVVTKFSVGDMWAKLPEYTANANALGATVQDMYKSTTLYYQQGLNAEQAMGIAAETMKMARIAGLEAKDATDMMTAALRGFNMELSETSAQRINDVYSNLAAKTASDTKELGNAMQRTASIAANAGMTFEGTATFLAQAIETTREPAENIGTAMKTIIARMQEMKKNPLEIGEVDGEEVDYNKIDAALKTVGISLQKANGDFRDNDEVLLDISKHWNSLTQTQQRYIATTIAGSRQQSRFIAMVGNYERTQELLKYANDSEGASQEQFGKTLDSLEAKLNKFHNAWNDFLMSIMNDSWTKAVVSGATSILTVVNKLINTLSFGNKGIKSALSLFTAFNALKMAGMGTNMVIGGIGGMMSPGSSFKEGFLGGASGLASKGTNKIVKAIYDLVPHIDKAAANEQYKHTGFGDYKKAQKELAKQVLPNKQKIDGKTYTQSGNEYSIAGVNAIFDKNKLNKEQQKALLDSMPGLKKNMTKSLAKIMQDAGTDPKVAKGLIAGFKKGDITSEQVLQKSGLMSSFPEQMKQITEEQGEEAAKAYKQAVIKGLNEKEGLTKNLFQQGKQQGLSGQALRQFIRSGIDKRLQGGKTAEIEKALNATRELSKSEGAANTLNAIGSAATSAGMSLQMLGSQIAVTNPIVGEAITQLGGLVMALGSIPNAITGIMALNPAMMGVVAAVAALGVAYVAFTHHAKKLTEAAEDVQKKFTDLNSETQKNIATLKQYQQQAGQWAKGVDSYGNNVSLTDDEYNQYLNAVDEIAKINPSIVEGYNAQGHAIININKALSETLALEKQRQEKAFKDYLDPTSLDKLVKARNVDSNYLKSTTTLRGKNGFIGDVVKGMGKTIPFAPDDAFLNIETWLAKQANAKLGVDLFIENTAPFQDDVQNIVDNLQKDLDTKDLSEFLSPFGIDWGKLSQNDATEIQKFVQRRNDIYSAAMKASKGELSKDFTEAFTSLDENSEAFSESIDNTLQWLRTYVSQSDAFEGLPEELKQGISKGLENIAMQPDLTANEMMGQADDLVKNFEKLINSNSKYTKALEIAEEAQDRFASTVNETEYKANVQPAIDDLIRLKEEALNKGTAYGDALAEYLENQIQRISNFTKEGGASLSEALNTATDEIAAAEGALESFNNATKTDYSTAAEGMKSIFDKVTETSKDSYGTEIQKHAEGMGDATFWTGADALLGTETVDKITANAENGYDAAAKVSAALKEIEPLLRDGQEGFDAFTDRVLANGEALDKIEGVEYDKESGLLTNIPDEKWHEVAEALGISDDLLASMLSKGRQFAEISFMNVEDARKALAASDYTIKGTSAAPGEQENLYVKEDTLRAELANAGYVRREQQDEQIAKLLNEGVKTIPADAKNLDSKQLQSMADDWGIKTLPDLIQTLNETGDFTKDEIHGYAEQLGLLGSEDRFDSLYSDIIEAAENPELAKQTGVLETISAQIAALTVSDSKSQGKTKKELKNANKELLGGKGIDTDAQAFAYGKKLVRDEKGNIVYDKNGEAKLEDLSAGEYEETKKSMQAVADSYKETAAMAEAKVKSTTGEEKKYWEEVQKTAEEGATRANKYIQMSEKAMAEHENDIAEAEAAKDSKDKGREQERKAQEESAQKNKEKQEKAEAERKKKEQEARDTINADRKEPRKLTDVDENRARDEAKEAERKAKENEANKKATEAKNEARIKEEEAREAQRKQAEEAQLKRNKERTEAQKKILEEQARQEKIEAEGRAREIKAREEAKAVEQQRQLDKQHEQQGDVKEDYWRNRNKQEEKVQQIEDIQGKVDTLLGSTINTSLKTALDNLDPTQIASSPEQAQAFSNLYKDLIDGTLPKPEDLQTLGIFGQLDSQFQDQITNNVKEKTTQIGEGLQSAVGALTDLDKAAFAMEVVNTDSVGNLITSVGERLKSWLDKINGLEGQNNTPQPNVAPTINTGTNTVAQIAQNTAEQVQGKVTFDTSDGEAKLDNLQAKAQETISIVEQGATFKVKVQSGGLSRVAKQANTINKASGNKNINVTATASGQEETENLTTAVKDFKALSDKNVKLSVTVSGLSSISSAISQVHSFYNLRDDTVTLTTKHENKATGGHNHGYAPAPPSLGSAARGSYGQIGPKGKGGLTLTGELGYEIAWLPDENRSMILGAEGPQMVNLPGNAVVWTHEQSKRMMKQKAIPAGSHADESANAATYIKKYANNTSTNSGSTILSIAKDTGTSLKDTVKDAAIKVGKVSVFWENLAHRIEGSQRIMDRNASNFENYLKDMRATLHKTGQPLSSGGGGGNDYIKSIQAYSYLNQLQYNKATKSLKKYTKKNKKNKVKIKWKEGKQDKSYRFNFNDFIKYDSGLDTFSNFI